MNERMNGHSAAEIVAENEKLQQPTPQQILEMRLTPVAQAAINGMLVSNPGFQPDSIMVKICEVFGFIIGGCCNGATGAPIASVFAQRGEMKRAFERGMGNAKIVTPPVIDQHRQKATGNG